MEKEFEKYLRAIHDDASAAVVLAGDLLNNGIKSSKTNVYDEIYTPREQKIRMVNYLRPIKEKIVCCVRGNHEFRTTRETSVDVMEDICRELGIENIYAQDMGFLKISLGEKPNKKPATYMFCVTHGAGSGQLLGSGLNKPDGFQMSIEGVDGIISGHTHKPMKVPSARLVFDTHNNNVVQSKTLVFVCTAWLKYGGYPCQKMMKPVAWAPDTIRLDGRIKQWS
jgi:predicted phosphodiesterase